MGATGIGAVADLAPAVIGMRLHFMTNLPTWNTFGKGWARRIASLLQT